MRGLEFGLSDTFFVAMIESIDSLQRAEVSTLHIMADHIRDNVSRVQPVPNVRIRKAHLAVFEDMLDVGTKRGVCG